MAQQTRTERTLTPRIHTRLGPEDTQGGLVEGASRRDFLRLTMLGSLGDVTGWIRADPSGLTGRATLAVK